MKIRVLGGVLVAAVVIPLLLIGGIPFALLMALLGAGLSLIHIYRHLILMH